MDDETDEGKLDKLPRNFGWDKLRSKPTSSDDTFNILSLGYASVKKKIKSARYSTCLIFYNNGLLYNLFCLVVGKQSNQSSLREAAAIRFLVIHLQQLPWRLPPSM